MINLFEEYISNSRIYNEASFAEGSIDKIINNFLKVVGKRAKLKFKGPVIPYSIQFKNKYGNFEGVKFMTSDYNRAIRINWKAGKSTEIDNIDIWLKPKSVPDKNIDCKGLNIVQIVDIVSTVLGGKAFYKESLFFEASAQFNKNERKEIIDEVIKSNKIKINGPDFKTAKILKLVNEHAKKKGYNLFSFAMVNEYVINYKNGIYLFGQNPSGGLLDKIRNGSKEEIQVDSAEDKVWKSLKAQGIEAKLSGEETFEQITEYTKLLIHGKSSKKLLMIAGDPGLGKTYEVEDLLKRDVGDGNYEAIGGKITPLELYKNLWKHNGKILLLDDIDVIFDNNVIVNLLKKATDSKEERWMDYASGVLSGEEDEYDEESEDEDSDESAAIEDEKPSKKKKKKEKDGDKAPKRFLYTGKVIIITNRYFNQLPGSLLSRALRVEVNFTPEQALDRIKSKLKELEPNVPMKIKQSCFDFLIEISPLMEKVDFRKFSAALVNFAIEGIDPKKAKKWSLAGLTGDSGAAGKRK